MTVLSRSTQCHTSLSINFTEWTRAVPELLVKVGQLFGENAVEIGEKQLSVPFASRLKNYIELEGSSH